MAIPLVVALAIAVVGGSLAHLAAGVLWGLVAAGGLLVGMRMGRIAVSPLDAGILLAGMAASTALSTIVLPGAPATADVLLSVRFAGAWLPAAVASAVVVARGGANPSAVVNTGLAWLVGGAVAIPVAVTLGVLTPLDTLRRGAEAQFGAGDTMTLALVVAAIGMSAVLAVATRLPALATATSIVAFTVFAGASVGFSFSGPIGNLAQVATIPNLWPPNFAWAIGSGDWWWLPSWEFGDPNAATNPLIETIRIAITATVLGCAVALPVAFMASTLTAPNRLTYLLDKGFLNFIRTIPDLFWALIFVASLGFGLFAGALALVIFSMSIMGKLLSETVDAAEPGPLEAAKAAGSPHFPALRASVLPQVLPNYVALSLYIFELNIRSSAVLGIVGAGGIGRVIEAQRIVFRFDRVLAVLIPIFVLVLVVEQISTRVRRRLV